MKAERERTNYNYTKFKMKKSEQIIIRLSSNLRLKRMNKL